MLILIHSLPLNHDSLPERHTKVMALTTLSEVYFKNVHYNWHKQGLMTIKHFIYNKTCIFCVTVQHVWMFFPGESCRDRKATFFIEWHNMSNFSDLCKIQDMVQGIFICHRTCFRFITSVWYPAEKWCSPWELFIQLTCFNRVCLVCYVCCSRCMWRLLLQTK